MGIGNRLKGKLQLIHYRLRWWWWVGKLCSPTLTARNSQERAGDTLW